MKPKSAAKRIAFCAAFSALAVVLMWLSVLIPTLDLTLAALAAIPVYIALLDFGYGAGIGVYAAAGILSLLLVPDKTGAVFFCALFGWYPFLRNALASLSIWLSVFLKLLGGALGAGIVYLVLGVLFPDPEILDVLKLPMLILIPIVFFLYDYALGKLMFFYTSRIRLKLHR